MLNIVRCNLLCMCVCVCVMLPLNVICISVSYAAQNMPNISHFFSKYQSIASLPLIELISLVENKTLYAGRRTG